MSEEQETHKGAVERATAYEAVQADRHQRAEEIILTIASREPSLPYPLSLARACVAAMKREGLL